MIFLKRIQKRKKKIKKKKYPMEIVELFYAGATIESTARALLFCMILYYDSLYAAAKRAINALDLWVFMCFMRTSYNTDTHL